MDNYPPPPPPGEGSIPEETLALARRLVQRNYLVEKETREDKTNVEPEMALLISYASLLLGQCGATGIGPSEALNAAFYTIGAKTPPGVRVH